MTMPRDTGLRELRQVAEDRLARGIVRPAAAPARELRGLLHELSVHQVELDLQNEHLRTAQEALEHARNRYFDLYEEAPVAYLTVSGSGSLIACNRLATTLLEIGPHTFARKRFVDLLAPAYHERFAECQVALALSGGVESFAAVMRRESGTRFWATVHMSVAATGSGSDLLRVAIVDVDEQRRTEQGAERLAGIVTSSTLGIYSHDLNGSITSWNAAASQILGYTEQQLMGRNTSILLPSDRKGEDVLITSQLVRGERVACDTVRLRKDGVAVNVTLSASPIRNASDVIIGVSQVIRDASAQVASREALRSQMEQLRQSHAVLETADRRKDELIATLAHELRSPLASIRNASALLGHDVDLDRRSQEIINRQVGHISTLMEDLSDVARIAEGKIAIRREILRLGDVLAFAVEDNLALIEARQHRLHLELTADDTRLSGDMVRLTQAFGNLLANAAKYTERGGDIWVTATKVGDAVEVRVRDSGVGMHADFLPRAFTLFAQVESVYDRTIGGLGIGLFLVKTLVELHDGTVTVTSPGINQGSEFIVALPVVQLP